MRQSAMTRGCLHTHIYIYMYIFITNAHTHTYIHKYIYCIYVYIYMYYCIYVYIYTYICKYKCIYIYIYMYRRLVSELYSDLSMKSPMKHPIVEWYLSRWRHLMWQRWKWHGYGFFGPRAGRTNSTMAHLRSSTCGWKLDLFDCSGL